MWHEFTQARLANPMREACRTIARAVAPRRRMVVSQWADNHRVLSRKGSQQYGKWRTDRNPPLREPMDAMSACSAVHEVVLKFPVQYGKTEVALNAVGCAMDRTPGPIMVALPGEVSMNKWIEQKLNPMIEETDVVRAALTSTASRDGANRCEFKDFAGGQLYLEHAGSPARLASTTVWMLIVDEIDKFPQKLADGGDPVAMLDGRTTGFPNTYKRLYISTPEIKGLSRIDEKYENSDRRRYYVPCPHCDHEQPLEWSGLRWDSDGTNARYICRDCGAEIEEFHKTSMIARGRWVAENPGHKVRGYHINGLYYQIGLGLRWDDLVAEWLAAQNDPAKLKTFINERLAESFEDRTMRAVKVNLIADRAEPYPLRTAPEGVLVVTWGADTQDNRLAAQIVGWGMGGMAWTLDYNELPGDPEEPAVWEAFEEFLKRPIQHADGGIILPSAGAIDIAGHRSEAVKAWLRKRALTRAIGIRGATANTAPVLNKGKPEDVTWKGIYDKRSIVTYQVGTVAIKNLLFARISGDADKPDPATRMVHFSEELGRAFFDGIASETYNPAKNRYEKRRGARNEPLDTWGYAYAATHHPELRMHRWTRAEWEARAIDRANRASAAAPATAQATPKPPESPEDTQLPRRANTARRQPARDW